jgi:glycosyltransferase involved in cell wall biosynthesis
VVVDPGSTDGSRELISEFARDHAVTPVFEPDAGPGDGLNKGFERATGSIMYYLNADDELMPGGLAQIADWHATSDADVIYGDGWVIDEGGEPVRFVRSDTFTPLRFVSGVGVVLQQATSFKRRVWDAGLRFNPDNRLCWDTEFLCDVQAAGFRLERRRGAVGYFRIYPTSITGSAQHSGPAYRRVREELEHRMVPNDVARRGLHLLNPAARAVKRATSLLERRQPFPGRVA